MSDYKIAVIPDTHIPDHDPKAVAMMLTLLKWYRPQRTVILGDFMDCAPVSHWLKNKRKELEGKRLKKDFDVTNQLLDEIQRYTTEIDYISGNHEKWLEDAVDQQPEFDGLIDLDVNLRFKSRPITRYVKYGKCLNLGKLWFTHGTYTGVHHAKKHVEAFGRSIVYGHVHDVQSFVKVSPVDVEDKHLGLSLGCLAKKNPHFMRNRPNNWVHCVGLGMIRGNDNFSIDPVLICNGKASYAGKVF